MNTRVNQNPKKTSCPKKKKTIGKISKAVCKILLYWIAFTLCLSGLWIARKFGDPSFEQIIYHIKFSSDGLIDVDVALVRSFIRVCLIYPVILSVFIYLYEMFVACVHKKGFTQTTTDLKSIFNASAGKIFASMVTLSNFIFKRNFLIYFLIASSIFFLSKVSFWSYISNRSESNFFDKNYVTPTVIEVPQKKKNLVLIYVESLETTYSNKQIFGKDLLAELNAKTNDAVSFENYEQTSGTGWTIAAIVATQCGIPLRPIMNYDGNQLGESVKQFLPNITCMGDILKKAGYKNIFMGGAALSFAGKGKFLSSHGYDELYGKLEWEAMALDENDFNGWGLSDDVLLNKAKKRLDELEKGDTPFNLTILTLDTHHSDGFISNFCRKKGVHDFAEIVECTSTLLADFLDYIYRRNYIKDTNVVILGDHLAMRNTLYEKLQEEPNRTIFNKFISSEPLEKNREQIYSFAIMPSTLYSMGFRFKNNRLGLGASGFGELDPNFTLNKEKKLNTKLSSYSKRYLDFWKN